MSDNEFSAEVELGAQVGLTTKIWHLAHVRHGARIGDQCVVGRGVYIGPGVVIGNRVKIQNAALIYEPATIGDGAFVGPGVVFTNDRAPRSVTPDGKLKTANDWNPVGVTVGGGASVGAMSVCVAPVTIGAWAMVAAGAVVVADVPDFALVAGVPARQIGWVGKAGERLDPTSEGQWECPVTAERYVEVDGRLEERLTP